MESTIDTAGRIRDKIEKLIGLHRIAKTENEKLSAENNRLQEVISRQEEQINALSEENKMVKLAKSITNKSDDHSEIRLKINELVREVDKCISLLNK